MKKSPKINRRKFLTTSGLAATAGLVAPSISVAAKRQSPVEIVFTHRPDDSGSIQKLLDRFNRDYQGIIKVTWRKGARDYADYYRQLLSDFSVESAEVDVIATDVPWTASFAHKKLVRDLSKRFFDDYDPEDFVTAAIDSVAYRYRVWGVPWYTDLGMLFYRKDLLEKSGFSQPPETWAQLRDMARKVMQESGVPYGYVFQGAENEGGVANALEFIWNAGGRVLTGNISVSASFGQSIMDPNVVTINSPDATKGLEAVRKIMLEGVAPSQVANYTELEAFQDFIQGKAVFMRNWPYVSGFLLDQTSDALVSIDQVGVARLPGNATSGKRYGCLGGWNLMVNGSSNREKTDAAWTFIRYATSPEMQEFMAREAGFLPTLKALYENATLSGQVPVIALAKEALNNVRIRPITPLYDQISPRIARSYHRIVTGQLEAGDAVEQLEDELRTIIRKNRF